MPRPAKPLQVIDYEGKYRLTRAERERRERSEVKIGSKKLTVPADIKDNDVARKKFLELVRIYDGCNFVSSSDVDMLAEYCKLSLPLSVVKSKSLIIAYQSNGLPLHPEIGYPLIVVAEDKLGYKWARWVTKIELSDDENYRGFWEQRGYDNQANVRGN